MDFLTQNGELSIEGILDCCRRLLPDHYLLWPAAGGFSKDYSKTLMNRFERQMKENFEGMSARLKAIAETKPEKYVAHKMEAYLYHWMLECHAGECGEKNRDGNYHISMARASSGLGNREKADVSVDSLIDLNRSVETSTLQRVSLILTYRCNLRCRHCWIYDEESFEAYHMKNHVTEPELNSEEIRTLIRKSKLLKQASISLSGGELTLRKDLDEILSSFAEEGVPFEFFTNGTSFEQLKRLVSDSKIRKHLQCVVFSLDGDRETHNLIRGMGVFDKLKKSVDLLQSHGVKIRLATVIMEQNLNQLDRIRRLGLELGCSDHDFNLHFQGGRPWALPDIREIRPYLYDNAYFKIIDQDRYTGSGCLAGITRCSIMPNGRVEACSTSKLFDHFLLGNLRDYEFDFDSLWISDAATEVRNSLRKCPGCAQHCDRG